MHQLTKTDFIQYLNCPQSLWLLKNKPKDYPKGEFSLFLEKLIKEGYEVEVCAQKLFPEAFKLPDFGTAEFTKQELELGEKHYLQATFETEQGAFARVDILERKEDGTWHIYEVKSSTSVKTDKKHNHFKDACFQKVAMERCGYKVSQVSIINLNGDYVREGDINVHQLLKINDVTQQVEELYPEVEAQIDEANQYINQPSINTDYCLCREKTRSNHCDSFKYFNTGIPEHNIYEINRISQKKVIQLVDDGITFLGDVPDDFKLNDKQKLQVESFKKRKAITNQLAIHQELAQLEYPLHFIDYETYASAVPRIDGVKPHQHIPFQVSIHTMDKEGNTSHHEYLAEDLELPEKLIKFMESTTGKTGTFISWHASFESSRNDDMIEWYPKHRDYLTYMNKHMFDLEDIFKENYVDYQYRGSTSIKKVLPIVAPHLSYDNLEVQNGTMALDTWGRLVLDDNFEGDKKKVRKELLEYCKMDTWAMVEVYVKLKDFII